MSAGTGNHADATSSGHAAWPSIACRGGEGQPALWLPAPGSRLAAFTHTIRRFPNLDVFLGAAEVTPLELASFNSPNGVIAWGAGLPARMAHGYAKARSLPFLTLEDGFLRSVGLGKQGAVPVSVVADDLGAHFNAGQASRLETLVTEGATQKLLSRACDLRALIVRERLSKYNHLPDRPVALPRSNRRRILLVDQVAGDRSIQGAGASARTFRAMWEAACREPGTDVYVKLHPDVIARRARGHLGALRLGDRVIADAVSPHALLDQVDEVWTVSSQFGLDAVLRGIPVRTFGAPAYAGWGFTKDHAVGVVADAAFARRRARPGVDGFVAAAFLTYARYCDPVRREPATAEQAVERLISWRRRALGLQGTYLCVGLSRHKHKTARLFLEGPWSRAVFAGKNPSPLQLRRADTLAVWGDGSKVDPKILASGAKPVIRIEDGFIRSVGLGSAKAPPASLCFETDGIFFDATQPNGLERLLNACAFDPALVARAKRLRQIIVTQRISKYNLATERTHAYRTMAANRSIVVVGAQVPCDASLRHGLPVHTGNLELLAAVRGANPGAFVVYKDHPDLLSGHRPGSTPHADLRRYADLIVGDATLADLLEAADVVHVATSQLGFEALLRGRRVVCHGLPFYAGWGLTSDRVVPLRPRRNLTLDQLVAGVLILYPRYVSLDTGLPCEVEDVLREIERARRLASPTSAWLARAWLRAPS